MRLATFNIKHGELAGLGPLIDLLRKVSADLVALQEVDAGVQRSGGQDQAAELGAALGMACAFGQSMPLQGGSYGCALLVRGALLRGAPLLAQAHALPGGRLPGEEPRTALVAQIGALRLCVTHLDLPAALRVRQVRGLLERLGALAGTIILGDLNEPPDGPAVAPLYRAGFRDAWTEAGERELTTGPHDRPRGRIDQILLGPGVPRAVAAAAWPTQASDHALVSVDLEDREGWP